MRILMLSDNTDSQVQLFEENRARANQALADEYDLKLARWTAPRLQADAQVLDAWRSRRFFGLFAALYRRHRVRRIPLPPAPVYQVTRRRQEIVWEAGREGENRVFDALNASPGDDWTLVKGYISHGGEIDFVAVGPAGVAAIEVKSVNGVVHCDGDRWWRDKYDRFGNLCEQGIAIADRKGRSPSRQVNESSAVLAAAIHLPVARVVALAHERSGYGNFSNLTVNLIARIPDLDLGRACSFGSRPLTPAEVEGALQAIRRSAASWQRWKARKSIRAQQATPASY